MICDDSISFLARFYSGTIHLSQGEQTCHATNQYTNQQIGKKNSHNRDHKWQEMVHAFF
jgi:hypothetical protein